MHDDHPTASHPPPEPPQAQRRLARRATLINGIAVLFLFGVAAIVMAADALLLTFACILCAVLLYKLSDILHRRFGLNRKVALTVIVLLLLAIIGLGGWAMAPQISEQSNKLAKEIPAAVERLQNEVAQHPLLKRIASELPPPETIVKQLGNLVPNAGLFFTGVLGAVGNVIIILFVGIYFAATPHLYTSGAVRLIPQTRRDRARQVLQELGHTLASWLMGKAASMLIVGIATSVGLSMLGVPLALILGIIAGLLDFIPYLGPIMAGVPAVLLALSISPELALYTVLLFVGVQLVEGYLLQPLIEARAVDLPPALVIVMQLIFGTLFGFAGVALATPLAAVLSVLVKMLYIEDVLGDRTPARKDSG
ncbi:MULTISPECIES: AI-2E family transporter [unclassified Massilia]|uniref:AI-2E family transporter n=1 Tax=unclassified Massilia TaxID=2609279 RepID=UPI001B830A48|nr:MULTISPECIES: AI-2E family transporter [unclassified Massilia]MBQ5942735.1 AI-2E family transporter [Massilia sp. AB1]MBQ5965004.1 AI-2E family transporter [Massilia sp. ZL223]